MNKYVPAIKIFRLPVVMKKTKEGVVVMFPGNRFHVNTFADTELKALDRLEVLLTEILRGERNVV